MSYIYNQDREKQKLKLLQDRAKKVKENDTVDGKLFFRMLMSELYK